MKAHPGNLLFGLRIRVIRPCSLVYAPCLVVRVGEIRPPSKQVGNTVRLYWEYQIDEDMRKSRQTDTVESTGSPRSRVVNLGTCAGRPMSADTTNTDYRGGLSNRLYCLLHSQLVSANLPIDQSVADWAMTVGLWLNRQVIRILSPEGKPKLDNLQVRAGCWVDAIDRCTCNSLLRIESLTNVCGLLGNHDRTSIECINEAIQTITVCIAFSCTHAIVLVPRGIQWLPLN